MSRRVLFALLALALSPACAARTQLLLVVDSDLIPGAELAAVTISTRGPGGSTSSARVPIVDATSLPFSVGVAPEGGDASRPVTIHVEGRDASDVVLVRWVADTGFVAGRTLGLPVRLARACTGEPFCDGIADVCDDGACRAPFIDPTTLTAIDPAASPARLFDGSSPPLPGVDGGGACAPGEPCDTPSRCERGVTACEPARCEVAEVLAPGTTCGDGRTCDAAGVCR